MMLKWEAMLDDIMPDLKQCPRELVEHHLKMAAIRLCEESHVYRHNCEPYTAQANEAEVSIDCPSQTEVITVVRGSARWNGSVLSEITDATVPANNDGESGTPTHYYIDGDCAVLIPAPNQSGTFTATVAVRPLQTADGINATLYSRYREGIVAEAKRALKSMADKPWTDRPMLMYYEGVFERVRSRAQTDAIRKMTSGVRRAQPVTF